MGKLRSINTVIWSDTWFEDLDTEEKLLFIYLITNEKTNMLGVYETSIKKMSFETGIQTKKISETITKFVKDNRIKYISNRVVLLNFLKHQRYNTNMLKSAIDCYNELPNELKLIEHNTLSKDSKGFGILLNHFGRVRKVEVEVEVEVEINKEKENSNLIIPQMLSAWLEVFPNYAGYQINDFPALKEILDFMIEQKDVGHDIENSENIEKAKSKMRTIAMNVKADKFYNGKSLDTIRKKVQEFYTSKHISESKSIKNSFDLEVQKILEREKIKNERIS